MSKVQEYLEFKKAQEKEMNDFPIAYAFDKKQLDAALEQLGATIEEVVTVFNMGDIVKKEDAPKYIAMLTRHTQELKDKIVEDKEFAAAAFRYEMDNHEYAINYDGDDDVLSCFGLKYDDLIELGLKAAYMTAREGHMKYAREWM